MDSFKRSRLLPARAGKDFPPAHAEKSTAFPGFADSADREAGLD
jgi:hypothetical protein